MNLPREILNKDFALQIRKLRELILLGNGKEIHSVLITGMSEGDGATTVAANLAYDLCKTNNFKPLFVANNKDVTIAAKDLFSPVENIEEVIKQAPGENLNVTGIGWQRGRKSWVRDNKLENLFEHLKSNYSYVIIDAPPVQECPEVLMLLPFIDLTLVVIKSKSTKWQAVYRVKKLMQEAKAHLIGIVINKKKYYIPKPLYKRL